MGTRITQAYRAALVSLALILASGKAHSACYEHYAHIEQLRKQNAVLLEYNRHLLRQNTELNWKLSRVDQTHPWGKNPDKPRGYGKGMGSLRDD